jgi:short-subunit dehydrogenase
MQPERALVTGASRGIGRAIAEALASRGIEVIGACRRPEEKGSPPGAMTFLPLDLADPESVARCAAAASPVDLLVNNAGQSQVGALEDSDPATLRALFEVNFFGTVEITRLLLPAMRRRQRGGIVNIGSLAGRFPVPFQSAYVASKCALAAWTAALRHELRPHRIRVALIEPSDIRTGIEPEIISSSGSPYAAALATMKAARDAFMQEAGPPDQVARAVLHILDTEFPRPAYPVGGKAALLCLLQRFLPGVLVEKLVRKHYRLG